MKLRWSLVGLALGAVLVGGCVAPVGVPETKVMPVVNLSHGGAQAPGYYELGRYYQGQNRYALALDAYDKALAADPHYAEALNGRAAVFAAQGRYEDALRDFKAALAIEPGAAHVYNNLGYTLLLQQRPADAIAPLEEAARLDPGSAKVWNNLAAAYTASGNRAGAESASRQAAERLAGRASPGRPLAAPASTAPKAVPASAAIAVASSSLPLGWQLIGAAPGSARQATADVIASPIAATASPVAAPRDVAPATRAYRLEVSNGNGVAGLARKVSELLVEPGMLSPRLTNQEPYAQRMTEIQYRDGYAAAAASLGERLPPGAPARKSERLRFDTDVRVVLGADCAGPDALARIAATAPRIARSAESTPTAQR